jgi:hypothetical protein
VAVATEVGCATGASRAALGCSADGKGKVVGALRFEVSSVNHHVCCIWRQFSFTCDLNDFVK